MIVARNLQKFYGQGLSATRALNGVDLEIRNGEFVAIMGRSGSGKSTLLHALGLLDMPSGGDIYIDGIDALKMKEQEKARFRLEKLGYVFQEYSLLGELTILENVYLPALCSTRQENYKRRAADILDIVGLRDRLTHYPHEISGGEQQRVTIARALINDPRMLFADEPTASLDANSSKVVLELFQALNRNLGQTIVMVTHEPEDQKYVDRVIWLKDGHIEKETAPQLE
jgi:putative ABC transport system ATP-binding protein